VLGIAGAGIRAVQTVTDLAAGASAAVSAGSAGAADVAAAAEGTQSANSVMTLSNAQATAAGAGRTPLGVPPSILDGRGSLPAGIGGPGTPIPMPPSSNPTATAEAFARAAFNGQAPDKLVPIMGGSSWGREVT